ncbi:MAG: hypothetical protein HY901_38415 [Deltaproteobacteria bacterium]|nr:hypothetical protein [Deltaproteobacteria bacterium]
MLAELQRALEIIYGVSSPQRVEDFVIGQAALAGLGARVSASEELLVVSGNAEIEVGLYVDPELISRLPELGRGGALEFLDRLLPAFAIAAEGVSHFLYLMLQATRDRAVSLLELEAQAEVDKFATGVLHLWKHGERRHCSELRSRLFDRIGYRAELSGEEHARYAFANHMARGYAAFLESRFILTGCLEGLLAELRRSYRLRAGAKYAHLARHG